MNRRALIGGGLVVAGTLLLFRRPAAAKSVAWTYPIDPDAPYGPSWGGERPPGLPQGVRMAGTPFSAERAVQAAAEAQRLGPDFVATMLQLALRETNATFGLPIRRPYDGASAWGVFQFQPATWRDLARPQYGCAAAAAPYVGSQNPWDASPRDEVEAPVRMYACLWRRVVTEGGSGLDAARGVRVWQRGSSYYERYLTERERHPTFAEAWAVLRSTADGRLAGFMDGIDTDLAPLA